MLLEGDIIPLGAAVEVPFSCCLLWAGDLLSRAAGSRIVRRVPRKLVFVKLPSDTREAHEQSVTIESYKPRSPDTKYRKCCRGLGKEANIQAE